MKMRGRGAAACAAILVAGIAAGCGGDADGRATQTDGVARPGIAGPMGGGQPGLADGGVSPVQDEVVPGKHETGVVKIWNGKFGWVIRDLGGELLMQRAYVPFDLDEGDRVWFDVVEGPKMLEARNVVAGDY